MSGIGKKGKKIGLSTKLHKKPKDFRKNIWKKPIIYNRNAKCSGSVEREENGIDKQENISIKEEDFTKQMRKMPTWKAPKVSDKLKIKQIKNASQLLEDEL